MYRFIVQAVNSVGASIPSLESYSVSTTASRPHSPERPIQISSTLNSITFKWHPPDDGGSALTGYRVYVKHLQRYVDLNRSSVTYTLRGLLAGKQYYIRVLAMNVVGLSEYSDYNLDDDSFTAIGKPETPEMMKATAGTWSSLTLEAILPYCNGSECIHLYLEHRIIEPFGKTSWSRPYLYNIENITILEPAEELIEKFEDEIDPLIGVENEIDDDPNNKNKKHTKKRQMFKMMRKKIIKKNIAASLLPIEEIKKNNNNLSLNTNINRGGILENVETKIKEEESNNIIVQVII